MCRDCQIEKPLAAFGKNQRERDGINVRCRDCMRVRSRGYYATNRGDLIAKAAKRQRERRLENPEHARRLNTAKRQRARARPERRAKEVEWKRRRYVELIEQMREQRKGWRNPARERYRVALRRARIVRATPAWADLEAIGRIYAEARRITLETGTPHDVDHIAPLSGANVCGLHVAGNLQILPASVNRSKGNRYEEAAHGVEG